MAAVGGRGWRRGGPKRSGRPLPERRGAGGRPGQGHGVAFEGRRPGPPPGAVQHGPGLRSRAGDRARSGQGHRVVPQGRRPGPPRGPVQPRGDLHPGPGCAHGRRQGRGMAPKGGWPGLPAGHRRLAPPEPAMRTGNGKAGLGPEGRAAPSAGSPALVFCLKLLFAKNND